jgi:formylglycine-generating enzyme required for sulfatase activity
MQDRNPVNKTGLCTKTAWGRIVWLAVGLGLLCTCSRKDQAVGPGDDVPAIGASRDEVRVIGVAGNTIALDSMEVWNSGTGTFEYTISEYASWLVCSPANGTSAGERDKIYLTCHTSGLAADTHSAMITISGGAAVAARQVPVIFTVYPDSLPILMTDRRTLIATCVHGTNAPVDSFIVWNAGTGIMQYSVAADTSWLTMTPAIGAAATERDKILITFATSTLAVGTHTAAITVTAPAAGNQTQQIVLTLTVLPAATPVLALDSSQLTASCRQGNNAGNDTFAVWNAGQKVLHYQVHDNAAWLSCFPASGSSTGEHDAVAVTYNTASLSAGTYHAQIEVRADSALNSPSYLYVTLNVASLPALALNTSQLRAGCLAGALAANGSFEVWNTGTDTLRYTISDDAAWLDVSIPAGTSLGEHNVVAVTYNSGSLAAGIYTATITVTAAGATGTPQQIAVTLAVVSTSGLQRGIPGGTFTMGTAAGSADERPAHMVTLAAFTIDSCEVTQADFSALMGFNPAFFTGDPARPVERLSWYDAVLYCNARSRRDSLDTCYAYRGRTMVNRTCCGLDSLRYDFTKPGYRLPTEAEWEYACGAGSGWVYAWGETAEAAATYAWYNLNASSAPHPVTKKQPNQFGLYDMAGNTAEWCHDWFDATYYTAGIAQAPLGPATGYYRVVRGGSWFDGTDALRVADRGFYTPDNGKHTIGFRCARTQ